MKKLIYLIPFILIGCHTPKEIIREVPVEVIKEVEKKVYVHDSVYTHDSIVIYKNGDTIFKDRLHTKYIERQVHDTLRTHDTVPIPITVTEKETVIEEVPQWWPVWLALGIVLLYLLITKTKFVTIIKNFIKYLIKLFK